VAWLCLPFLPDALPIWKRRSPPRGGERPDDLLGGVSQMVVGQSRQDRVLVREVLIQRPDGHPRPFGDLVGGGRGVPVPLEKLSRSEEHTSELQSRENIV